MTQMERYCRQSHQSCFCFAKERLIELQLQLCSGHSDLSQTPDLLNCVFSLCSFHSMSIWRGFIRVIWLLPTLTETCPYISTLWGTCSFTQPLIQLRTLYKPALWLGSTSIGSFWSLAGTQSQTKSRSDPWCEANLTKEWPNHFSCAGNIDNLQTTHTVQIKGFKRVTQRPHQNLAV